MTNGSEVPNVKPPISPAGPPLVHRLAAESRLYRVGLKIHEPSSFNPQPADRDYGGGRFDGTDDDPYSYMYVGDCQEVAICETFLRDLAPEPNGNRAVPLVRVVGRKLSILRNRRALNLVDLSVGRGLGAYSQDTWLTTTTSPQYAFTRHWAHWIRAVTHKNIDGFRWRSFREPLGTAMILFGDRLVVPEDIDSATDAEQPLYGDFDTAIGHAFLSDILAEYGAFLGP